MPDALGCPEFHANGTMKWRECQHRMPEKLKNETDYKFIGLIFGPLAAFTLLALPIPAGLSPAAWATAAIAAWMAIWWASEAIPVAATALLPLVLFPVLGVLDIGQATAPFANPLIFLFLGGFLIALTMERWNLHRRIALQIIALAGNRQTSLIGGVMAATALLSMWISNTATTMMMVPIVASLAALARPHAQRSAGSHGSRFATALMLATAYSASIGGLATLVGSPSNALLAAFLAQNHGIEVGFARWMLVGLPVAMLMLPLAWLVLTKVVFRLRPEDEIGGSALVAEELQALGPITTPEKLTAAVFALVAALWITSPLLASWTGPGVVSDAGIAIAGALVLFVIPVDWKARIFLLDWAWAKRAPWDILILFGGGLSLAQAFDKTGLATWLGGTLTVFGASPTIILVLMVTCLTILLTELTSNTATTAAFLPVVGAVAIQFQLEPSMLAVPAALAASCAFMLPVATPPNAIVFGTGHVTIRQMVRSGLLLNLIGVGVITLITITIVEANFVR